MIIGYARVSTRDQHPEVQEQRLREAGCERVYVDVASGKLASRPAWDECRASLRSGDVLVLTKLDRAGRSVKDLCEVAAELEKLGAGLRTLDQAIDTTSAPGKMFFHIVAAFAEFEHSLIVERTRDGLAATPKRGRKGGPKHKLQPYQVEHARAELDKGRRPADVAAELGIGRSSLYRYLGQDNR